MSKHEGSGRDEQQDVYGALARRSFREAGQQLQTEAEERGHGGRTAGAAVGGGLGAVLGSFHGAGGAALGGLLGATLGALVGEGADRPAEPMRDDVGA